MPNAVASKRATTKKPTKPTKPAKPAKPAKAAKPAKPATKATKPAAAQGDGASPAAWAPDASGLARVRAGFGRTPADDVLFALGYPHLVVATDDPEPKNARDVSKLWKTFPRSATHVPRSILPYVYQYHLNPRDPDLFETPLPALDAATEMKTMFTEGARMLFFLEALLGSEAVATAAVDFLAKCPVKAWQSDALDRDGWNGIRDLGFVLLRVSEATRGRLVAKLEAVFAKVTAAQGNDWWRPVQALDVILHGRAGVERTGGEWADLAHARDDAAWVATRTLAELKTMKPADRARFDLQLGFVGGAKVVQALRDLKRFHSEHHREAKQQLARLA